jgi:hypothetical protein
VSWLYTIVATGLVLLGFVAGMVTFKRSLRWCPVCGATLSCRACASDRLKAR